MKKYKDITITSVADYLAQLNISDSTNIISSDFAISTVWRGQSDNKWDIVPSACRNASWFKNERNYYLEMLRMNPEEFNDFSELECLEKMQHYGIPTRLLDFSTNPLVALFFACCDNPKTDGVIFEVHGANLYRENSPYSKIVLEYALNYPKTAFDIDGFINHIKTKHDDIDDTINNKERILETLTKPVGILPNYKNPRLANQSGVFFMCGLEIKSCSDTGVDFIRKKYSNIEEFSVYSRTITIPYNFKASILEVLSVCGISSKTMFPELPGLANYVLNNTNKKFKYDD